MDIRLWGRNGVVLLSGIGLALLGGLVLDRATAGPPPTGGPQAPGEPSVVLGGSYTCSYTVTLYYVGPVGDPNPAYESFAETSDNLFLSSSGGNAPVGMPGPGFVGPGFGGVGPIGGRPVVGGTVATATPVSGFGTGHSFNDGSIEDCVRFAQTMSAAARGLGCATSDVRRRQPPQTPGGCSDSASFSLVCEGPQADIVHSMGELSRVVLALKLQSVH